MIQFLGAATALLSSAAGEVGKIGSLLSPSHPKDQERHDRAAASLTLALGGDLASAQEILQLRFNSGDAYGRQQYTIAWNTLADQNPALAQEALKTRINTSNQSDSPSVTSQLTSEWQSLVNAVKVDVGNAIQRVGSGVATGAANAVDPNTSRYTLPLGISSSTVLYVGIAIAVAVLAYLFFGRKK